MLPEAFPGCTDLLETTLCVVTLTLEHNKRAGQFVGHFRATVLQFILATTKLFQFALLFFDLLLLSLELEQLLLRLLHLRIQVLGRIGFVLTQFEHLFHRSNFFWHDRSGLAVRLAQHHIKWLNREFQIFR